MPHRPHLTALLSLALLLSACSGGDAPPPERCFELAGPPLPVPGGPPAPPSFACRCADGTLHPLPPGLVPQPGVSYCPGARS